MKHSKPLRRSNIKKDYLIVSFLLRHTVNIHATVLIVPSPDIISPSHSWILLPTITLHSILNPPPQYPLHNLVA